MVAKNSEASAEKEEGRKPFGGQFWTVTQKNSESNDTPGNRAELAISRQFLPKKKQKINDVWNKQASEKAQESYQPFNYTPFKSTTMGRTPSINALETTSSSPPEVPKSTTVTLKGNRPRTISFNNQSETLDLYPNPYQNYSQLRDNYMQGVSIPKVSQHNVYQQQNGLQISSALPSVDAQNAWKNPVFVNRSIGLNRPLSAMNNIGVTRPVSRAASEIGAGYLCGGLESRYQSYTTLPRPEQIEYDQRSNNDADVVQLNKQMNMIYNPYLSRPATDTQAFCNQADVAFNRFSNRASSAMLIGAPGMASDYMTRNTSLYPEAPLFTGMPMRHISTKLSASVLHYDGILLTSIFQLLCALIIFTCGILRLLWGAKYAIGIELAYAILVLITSILGLYASNKRCANMAIVVFNLSNFNSLFGAASILIGFLPTLAILMPSSKLDWILNEDQPAIIDCLLGFTSFVETILSVIIIYYGCRAIGSTIYLVENMRHDIDAANPGNDTLLLNSMPKNNSKN